MQNKIRELSDISTLVAEEQKQGHRIVHCHGVFDLLHPGHLRHLQEAKKQGDKLVVSITPDRFVNKGPGRPAFTENLRLEQLAALIYVDYVVLTTLQTQSRSSKKSSRMFMSKELNTAIMMPISQKKYRMKPRLLRVSGDTSITQMISF